MKVPDKYAIHALSSFLKDADLHNISIGLRNLLIDYIYKNRDHDGWFTEFLEEAPGIFEFLDILETVYPDNENMNIAEQ